MAFTDYRKQRVANLNYGAEYDLLKNNEESFHDFVLRLKDNFSASQPIQIEWNKVHDNDVGKYQNIMPFVSTENETQQEILKTFQLDFTTPDVTVSRKCLSEMVIALRGVHPGIMRTKRISIHFTVHQQPPLTSGKFQTLGDAMSSELFDPLFTDWTDIQPGQNNGSLPNPLHEFGFKRSKMIASKNRKNLIILQVTLAFYLIGRTHHAKQHLFKETHIWDSLLQSYSVLNYLHRKSVIHGDIKPANMVIIGPDSSQFHMTQLIDFDSMEFKGRIYGTQGDRPFGTFGYLHPSAANPQSVVHEDHDFYALGVSAVESLTKPKDVQQLQLSELRDILKKNRNSLELYHVLYSLISSQPNCHIPLRMWYDNQITEIIQKNDWGMKELFDVTLKMNPMQYSISDCAPSYEVGVDDRGQNALENVLMTFYRIDKDNRGFIEKDAFKLYLTNIGFLDNNARTISSVVYEPFEKFANDNSSKGRLFFSFDVFMNAIKKIYEYRRTGLHVMPMDQKNNLW